MAERFALQHIDKPITIRPPVARRLLGHAPGQVHALLGENGAGKTTLMRIAYGLTRAHRGALRFNGVPVAIETPRLVRSDATGATGVWVIVV